MKKVLYTRKAGAIVQLLQERLHRYLSIPFLIMLTAASVLWYITKLGHTYTTDLDINVNIAGQKFDLDCYVEGMGTNLFGYKLYRGGNISIPIDELRFSTARDSITNTETIVIDPQSLNNAISVRYSDIKIISLDGEVELEITSELERAIDRIKRK